MTINFKSCAIRVHFGCINWEASKIDKSEFFLYDCNQIHYQISFMGQFFPSICNSSYWYYTEASWPFISKVVTSECNLGSINWQASKIDKSDFFLCDCNQIHYQISFMGQFVPSICNPLYWCHTEASWPFISKVVASGCNVHKLASKQNRQIRVFLYDCNQIHYQKSFMGQFVPSICNSSYWCHTEASWPFISKVLASGCDLGA